VLLLRRPPVWFLLQPLLATLRRPRETLFNGWFGPIGIAALFYAAEASQLTDLHRVWTIASLVVCGSIVVHGTSATPLLHRYGRPAAADCRSDPNAEPTDR
jgi:NhaP-type Na+/H+ or K+/H+ antiporter